jgi:hypothetical protein
MHEWNAREGKVEPPAVKRTTLVDVLFSDSAAYETLPACHVDWDRLRNPVVLWRLHDVVPSASGVTAHPNR